MGLELGTGPTCDPLVRGKASGMLEKNIGFGGSTDRIIGESKRERDRSHPYLQTVVLVRAAAKGRFRPGSASNKSD